MVTQSHNFGVMVIEDKNSKLLNEKNQILQQFTEYTRDLYNYKLKQNKQVLDKSQIVDRPVQSLPFSREEVEEAIRYLPNGKSPGIDNIPGELIQHVVSL